MTLRLYNTLTRRKEIFKPIHKGEVRIYTCGPTVYDYAHIGNFRSYIFADVLRRYLEYIGFKVKQVMNVTDVGHLTEDDIEAGEDKIELAAKKKKISPHDVARFYEKDFFEQIKKLDLKPAYKYPRATAHVKEMQQLIKTLLKKGHAYEVNGSVYYDITTFKNYGKLSGNSVEQLEEGASGRTDKNPDKKHFYDFALWVNDPKHLMRWRSPWSVGYPGWHIECSAMSMKYLGKSFDIHTGGEDNIFPHHEAEIAQSEGATGKKFVRYWMHVRHLLVDGSKMSKSLGNFYTPQDIYKKGFSPNQLRFFLLSVHYRQPFNFTFNAFRASNKSLQKLLTFMDDLEQAKGEGFEVEPLLSKAKARFERYMDDDLNVSGALSVIFKLVTEINKHMSALARSDAQKVIRQMNKFDEVLAILKKEQTVIPRKVKELIMKREQLRKQKKWVEADRIRKQLAGEGYIIQDTEDGPRVIIKPSAS